MLLSILIIPSCDEPKKESQSQSGDDKEIVEKGSDVPSSPQEITIFLGKPILAKGEDCPDGRFFGGIGIEHLALDDVIVTVIPGYPAFRAGLKVGDVLIGDIEHIEGEIGTPVTVLVRRGVEVLRFDMIREKICVK